MKTIASTCGFLATIGLTLIPALLAVDFGGVLQWTHYPLAIAVAVCSGLASIALFQPSSSIRLRRFCVLAILLLWVGYSCLQVTALPVSVTENLSPGSHAAYASWVSDLIESPALTQSHPISLAPDSSRHTTLILVVVTAMLWSALVVLDTRARIGGFLILSSLLAAVFAAYGFWVAVAPNLEPAGPLGFGRFVNRNNAALFMNLGLGTSLGLLSWRFYALTGHSVDDESFHASDLISLVNDRESLIAIGCAVCCVTGLLACGSRGGLAAILIGTLSAFGWLRSRRGMMVVPIVVVVVGLCCLLMLLPGTNALSLDRVGQIGAQGKASLLDNSRWLHWSDGWQAAKAYLPGGSGLATYAYAYLPFQDASPPKWFHHADNLWLELAVEQGIFGVCFALSIAFVFVQSLLLLGHSPDPFDQGLRTAGWFSFGVILFSQTFDFGLIVPANLFFFVMIVGAIMARAQAVRLLHSDSGRAGSLFLTWRQRAAGLATAPIAIVACCLCIIPLRRDAAADSIVRTIEHGFDEISHSRSEIESSMESLRPYVDERHANASLMSAKLQFELGRITEVYESAGATPEEATEIYRATKPMLRRLKWSDRDASPEADLDSEAMQVYRGAAESVMQALERLPLSIEARAWLIYLDFVHRDRQRSKLAIRQLANLQSKVPARLIQLATLGSQGGEHDLAVEYWREALRLDPSETGRAIEFLRTNGEIKVADVIPDHPINQRLAARSLLQYSEDDPVLKPQAAPFLAASLPKLECEECESKLEKSECEELWGDILYTLNRGEESFSHYETAINAQPTNPHLRSKYIDRLLMSGNRAEARKAAIRARAALPKYTRFQRIIDEMAEQDIREARRQQSQ